MFSRTGTPLAASSSSTQSRLRLRLENAEANDAADLSAIVNDGADRLPADVTAGHRPGDDPAVTERRMVVRSGSAGNTQVFVAGLRSHNIGFRVVANHQTAVSEAI